jgi:benzoylformate decarboxylase
LTTFFGKPGSTELPFLKNFPSDFQYILGLQKSTAVALADGFAQATRRPALVKLHTAAGIGNGTCNYNIMTPFLNKTPPIITAWQQTREMIICDPFLTNRDETMLLRPWLKWAYQPTRPQDVPGAIMRAYAMAPQPPSGPMFVSIPQDDWDRPALGRAVVRTVSTRFAPIGGVHFGSLSARISSLWISGAFANRSPALAFSIKAAATWPLRCASRPASSSNVSKMAKDDAPS